MSKKTAPYGTWDSHLTSDKLTKGNIGFSDVAFIDGAPAWVEGRPWESGRCVLCTNKDGQDSDIVPEHFNVRTRVHEYGGGVVSVSDSGDVWFNDVVTGQVYVCAPDNTIRQITKTPEGQDIRFADFCPDDKRGGCFAVIEIAGKSHSDEPTNSLCFMDGQTGDVHIIHQGQDFYTSPTLSPDGQTLAFVSWNHPNMPWDKTVVWLADLNADGGIDNVHAVVDDDDVSALHPAFAPNGTFHYVSDKAGYWQIYSHNPDSDDVCLTPHNAEYGLPHWVFGMRTYGFTAGGDLIATRMTVDKHEIGRVHGHDSGGDFVAYDVPFASYDGIRIHGDKAIFIAGHPSKAPMVVVLDTKTGDYDIIKQSVADILSGDILSADDISVAQVVTYPSDGGDVYAYYYPPANAGYTGIDGEKPPLMVRTHGGPTASVTAALNLNKIQYWTNRGFAVLDVNYSGSTGYGRAYRNRLRGQWGILDVADCVSGVKYLTEQGKIDPERVVITGGSAGGYTTLCALAFTDVFKAGCSSYGIGDITALVEDTHKFESRYMDSLIGPWPEAAEIYRERSAINSLETLNCPVIFLQGDEDKVVPPNQAEMMVDALNKKGVPNAYLLFEGEGHGFRKSENVKKAIDAELSFYAQIFGFQPAGDIPPVAIDNLS